MPTANPVAFDPTPVSSDATSALPDVASPSTSEALDAASKGPTTPDEGQVPSPSAAWPGLTDKQMAALKHLIRGSSICSAARTAGVSRSTVHRWIQRDPHFLAAYNGWRRELLESTRSRALFMADEAMTTIHEAITTSNVQAALAVAKAMGLLSPPRIGGDEPLTLARRLEVARLRRDARLYKQESDAESRYISARPLTRPTQPPKDG